MNTRAERNRRISELKTPPNYWDNHCRRCGWTFRADGQGCTADLCTFVGDLPKRADEPADWHSPAIVWGLLVEMNGSLVQYNAKRSVVILANEWTTSERGTRLGVAGLILGEGETPADAVTTAYIKMKEVRC